MFRGLIGDATLAFLAARTPRPVPTYLQPPVPPVRRTRPARARANGIELEYETFGEPGCPPIVLVMGLAAQMVAWHDEFCARLAARGFLVVRFDNRDIGRSTWLDEHPAPNLLALVRSIRRGEPVRVPYLLTDMADDVVGLLDALALPSAHLVGVSMGGMIAQTAAIHHPQRVRSLTSLMSHTGEHDLPHPHWRASAALLVPAPSGREAYLRRAVLVWRILNGPSTAIDLARTLAQSELAYARGVHPVGVVRQLAAILASPSRADALRALRTPTLVVHGDADPLVRVEGGRRTAALVPGAAIDLVAGMGHAIAPPHWERVIGRIVAHVEAAESADVVPG